MCSWHARTFRQAQVEALTKEYSDVIEEGGGKVGKTEYWGLKTIAFKIKKNRKAHYSLMNIDAPPAAIAEMERRMGLSPDVIRFITVRVDEHETEPSDPDAQERPRRARPRRRSRRRLRGGDRGGFRGGDRGGFRAAIAAAVAAASAAAAAVAAASARPRRRRRRPRPPRGPRPPREPAKRHRRTGTTSEES